MSVALPLLAGGLLALAELLFSASQPAGEPGPEPLRRVAWAACVGLGGIVASALVLLAATTHVGRSLPMTIAGTAAAVSAVALLSRARRR